MTSVKSLWIRFRAWLRLGTQLSAIGLFLLGVFAFYTASQVPSISTEPVVFLGQEVPAVAGLSQRETLAYSGAITIVIGVALSLKLITGSAAPTRYP